MGSKGDASTALAESYNGLDKAELIYHDRPWRNADEVEWATLAYIDRFNNFKRSARSSIKTRSQANPIKFFGRRRSGLVGPLSPR